MRDVSLFLFHPSSPNYPRIMDSSFMYQPSTPTPPPNIYLPSPPFLSSTKKHYPEYDYPVRPFTFPLTRFVRMENLLCDEAWLSSPVAPIDHQSSESYRGSFYPTKEDSEEALSIYLEKEISYMPEANYVEHLRSQNLTNARYRATRWLFRSISRLNLSFGAAFNAANYLDRFISMNQCNGWSYWMVELLSVACLSVASKFSETCTPTLHEIQMEDLGHSFESNTIQWMELTLLKALGWRLSSTTAYSYMELLICSIDFLKPLQEEITTLVTKLLLAAISDSRLLEFRPSVVAVSALWCSLDEILIPSISNAYLPSITRLFNKAQKDDLVKCHTIMEAHQQVGSLHNLTHYHDCPSSPTTVLLKQPIDICDCHVNFSFLKIRGPNSNLIKSSRKKRKREEQ